MPTPADRYESWARAYATRFGFDERHAAMLASWFDILGAYDCADLHAAAALLARRDYPSYASDHLKALVGVLREVVAGRLAAAAQAARQDRGTCTLCDGTGRVVVPHPRAVRGGRWLPLQVARGGASWYTCAVLCRCPLGAWYGDHGCKRGDGGAVPLLGLDEYEQHNPHWRDHLRRRSAEDLAVAQERSPPVDARHRLARERLDSILRWLTRSPGE